MTDKYTEKQLQHYENATSETAQNDALYRLGTHLEVIPCNGNTNLSPEEKQTVLDAAQNSTQNNQA